MKEEKKKNMPKGGFEPTISEKKENSPTTRPSAYASRGVMCISELYYCTYFFFYYSRLYIELELELIQTQMTQKPMLRAEVYARALRASQNRKEDSV